MSITLTTLARKGAMPVSATAGDSVPPTGEGARPTLLTRILNSEFPPYVTPAMDTAALQLVLSLGCLMLVLLGARGISWRAQFCLLVSAVLLAGGRTDTTNTSQGVAPTGGGRIVACGAVGVQALVCVLLYGRFRREGGCCRWTNALAFLCMSFPIWLVGHAHVRVLEKTFSSAEYFAGNARTAFER